jgi:glycosyltransferase involved in cell wall biosynthesis
MKNLFVSYSNVNDPDQGSGTWYNLYQKLKDFNPNMHAISLNAYPSNWLAKGMKKIHQFLGYPYKRYTDVFFARAAMKRLKKLEDIEPVEVLYTNDWGIAWHASRLSIGRKRVLYTDVYIDFSKPKSDQTDLARKEESLYSFLCLKFFIKQVLMSNAWVYLPSKDIIQAVECGNSISAKIEELPFGANNPNQGEVNVSNKFKDVKNSPRFLFIGKDMQRKRLNFTIEVFNLVKSKYPKAELHVVGPKEADFRKFCSLRGITDLVQVKNHGFLSRKSKEEMQLLDALYKSCHFYLFPSLSEGYNISILEAKSYGLITLGCDVIGVRGPIENGQTGFLLQSSASIQDWIDLADHLVSNEEILRQASVSAFESYNQTHKWELIAQKIFHFSH